jgi:hypothetical protein
MRRRRRRRRWTSIRFEKVLEFKTSTTENLGYSKLKQHILWFDEECSKLSDQRKQAKLQWLWNPNQATGDNLNDVRCETSRTLRNKKREYLKGKSSEPETNIKKTSETYIVV